MAVGGVGPPPASAVPPGQGSRSGGSVRTTGSTKYLTRGAVSTRTTFGERPKWDNPLSGACQRLTGVVPHARFSRGEDSWSACSRPCPCTASTTASPMHGHAPANVLNKCAQRAPPLYFTRRRVVTGTEPSCRAATLQESSSPLSSKGRTAVVSSRFGTEERSILKMTACLSGSTL